MVDNNSSDSSADETDTLRDELADIPLGEIQKLKETMGLKKYHEAMFGQYVTKNQHKSRKSQNEQEDDNEKNQSKVGGVKTFKTEETKLKKKTSAPEEVSSKIKKFRPRNVVELNRRRKRDPRFDDLSGTYNEKQFEQSYEFLNDIRTKEFDSVKKQLKKEKDVDKKAEMHKLLTRMKQQNKAKEDGVKRRDKESERKKEEQALVGQGKKPFYMKKSEKRKLELAEKYKELKSSGQLEKYLSKKRKRNATKEKKKLPDMK